MHFTKKNCILRLLCSVNGLLLLVLACLRRFCFSAFSIAVGPAFTFSDLTGLAVLALLLTSFASHCYFLRHRVSWFWIASIAKCCFIFDWRIFSFRFSRECGLVFLWICGFFWRLAGWLFWLKFACFLGLFFCRFLHCGLLCYQIS